MLESGDLDRGKKTWHAPLVWLVIFASFVVVYVCSRLFHFSFLAGWFLLSIFIVLFSNLPLDRKKPPSNQRQG